MKEKIISVVALISFFGLITTSLFIATTETAANPVGTTLTIKMHQIQKIDPIEGFPLIQGEADWYYQIYVYDGEWKKTPNIYAPSNTDNPILNDPDGNIHTFSVNKTEVIIYIQLMESDVIGDELADISGYSGGGKDDTTGWQRGAWYVGHYNLINNTLWGDKTQSVFFNGDWCVRTSGEMEPDNSIYTDENDAAILFEIQDDYGETYEDIDMLIVTNTKNLFDQYGSEAQELINKIEDIRLKQNGTLVDTEKERPLEISKLIKENAKKYEGLKYLMIVGGEEIIPFNWEKNPVEDKRDTDEYIATDYYYGDLNDDGYVDLAVGRIVGDDIEDMISMLEKSEYNSTSNSILVSGDDFLTYAFREMESILATYGFSTVGIYDLMNKELPSNIQDKSFIFHGGHANYKSWHVVTYRDGDTYYTKPCLETGDVQNNKLGSTFPFIYTVGCSAGQIRDWMDEWNSLPLAFIDQDAVGYIGGTGIQWSGSNTAIARYFIEEILNGQTVGEALKNAKLKYLYHRGYTINETGYIPDTGKKTILQLTLYGNPKYTLYQDLPNPADSSVNTTLFYPEITQLCSSTGLNIHTMYTNISIDQYNITTNNGYDLITIPKGGSTCDNNGYAVPTISTQFTLSANSEIYEVNLSSFSKNQLSGTYNLPIYQSEIIGSASINNPYPSVSLGHYDNIYSILAIENPNGTKNIVINIIPFEYHPETGEVYLHTDFNFSIEYRISNVQLGGLYIDKQYIDKGEEISISSNMVNTGLFLSNLTLETTVGMAEFETFVNQWNENSSAYDLAEFANNFGLLTTTFDEEGNNVVKTVIKDASGHTLDVKYGMFHVMQEPALNIVDTFVTQNNNITSEVNSGFPFTFVVLVDNYGDYNATDVHAELSVPFGIEIQDSLSKIVNDGTLPGFDTGYLQWILLADTPGDYTVSVVVSSSNGGTDSRIYNITVSQSEFKVEPDYQEVLINNDFTINLTINPGEPIAGFQFDLFFDENLITANSVTEGDIFNGYDTFFSPGTIDNINGKITGVYGVITTPAANVSNLGTLACIHFSAKGDEGTSFLNLSNVVVGGPNASPVTVVIQNGTVTITLDDTEPPVSYVNPITPYKSHMKEMPLGITVTAVDDSSGVREVSLYYRYSEDNTTWTDWMMYGENQIASSYTWQFIAPNGTGYYEFYSQAVDNADNPEPMPFVADTICRIYPNWDVNMDQNINVLDIITIGQHWGETGSPCWIPQDVNCDGVINILDIIIIAQHWTG